MGIFVLLLVVSASSSYAQNAPAESLSVEDAVNSTLHNHPLIEQELENVRASQAQAHLAGAPLRPNVSGSAGYTRLGPVIQFEEPGGASIDLFPPNEYDVHLGVSQRLTDFGRTAAAVDYAEANTKMAADNVEQVRWDLAYQTTATFYRILILRDNVGLLDEQIAALNEHLDISRKKFDIGTSTKLDVLTTQVRLASAGDARIDAVNALEMQEIALRRLMGLPADAPVPVRGSFARQAVSLERDSLLVAAMNQRPEILAAADAEKSASLSVRAASLGRRPTLGLNVMSGFKNGYFPNLERLRGNYAASLSMELPFFDGERTHDEENVATARLQAARARSAEARRRVTAEVEQARAGAQRAQERIANAEVQVQRADEALGMARSQYGAGVVTNLDLLDAQTSLSEARILALRARYDYASSLDALDRATGRRIW